MNFGWTPRVRLRRYSPQDAASSTQAKKTVELLMAKGARPVDDSKTEFEFPDRTRIYLKFHHHELAVIQVNSQAEEAEYTRNDATGTPGNHSGISWEDYKKLIILIEQIKPLGKFVKSSSINVIPTTEWLIKTDEYVFSKVIRKEKNQCRSEPVWVSQFSVYYQFRQHGIVESKRIESTKSSVGQITRFYVVVSGAEIEVSQTNFQRLKKGQHIKFERAFCENDFAKIISIKR